MSNVNEWSPEEDGNTHLDQYDLQQRINPHSPLNRYTKKIMAAVKAKADAMQAEIDTLVPMDSVVHIEGDETVRGVKTFEEPIVGDVSVLTQAATLRRTASDRFADVINVKDFGAKGDGSSDDTGAVQAAVTAAGTTGTVFFPQGTYCVTTVTAKCSLLGVGVQASVIKGTGSSGNVITWTGPERRTLSRLKIIVPDGCNGIQSNQWSWVTIHDAFIQLLGAGHGIDITIASSTTRALVATNFSIDAANPGYETVGIYFSRATDIRLSNFEITGCQAGIKVENTGSTLMLITNGHIWCGDSTKNQTQWFNGTRCIWCRGQAIVYASNFYADTCNTVFYCENAGSKIYVKNFMYWDDKSYNNACNDCYITQRIQTDDDCTFDIQGGLIDCRGKMTNVFGDYALTYSFTEVILPSGFTFSSSDNRLPRVTHYGNKSYTLSLVGIGYTPIAYVRNTGGGYLRFTLSDTTSAQRGTVEVLGSYVVNYYSNVTTSKLYYEYDSLLGMVILYLYHDVDDNVSITVESSTRYHDVYLHKYIYEGDSYTRFSPVTLDNADTLTLVSATSY